MADQLACAPVRSVEVSAVIIRACRKCGGTRQLGESCASCGNTEPARTHDLGVVSATYQSQGKRLRWLAIGQHLANFRIKKATRSA